jgi:vacuolar-type H+-ATPase subunit F/Vma7
MNNENIPVYKSFVEEEELRGIFEEFKGFETTIIVLLEKLIKKISKKYEKIEERKDCIKFHYDLVTKTIIIDLPTKENLDVPGRNHHRIVILPCLSLSKETIKFNEELIKEIAFKYKLPPGKIDSYTLVFIAMYNLDYRSFFRGRKENNVMFLYIISKNPRICLKRLYKVLIKFYKERLGAMIEAFNLDNHWYKKGNIGSFPRYLIGVFYKIDLYSYKFIKKLVYFIDKLETILKERKKEHKLSTLLYVNNKELKKPIEKSFKNYRKIPILLYIRSILINSPQTINKKTI